MIGNNWFCVHVSMRPAGCMFFRLFGYGLWLASDKAVPMVFSERNGIYRTLRFGNWRFKALTPWWPPREKKHR